MEGNIKLNCLAWLEIPYFIGVNFESTFPAKYTPDITVELKIKFRNDLIRALTSNRWMRSYDEYLQNYPQPLTEVIIPRYITETDIPYIRDLVKNNRLPYLHFDKLETVVELCFEIEVPKQLYDSAKQGNNFIPLFPSIGFFNDVVLPKIASVVDTYRVATLPAIRYTVHPVSESLIDTAFMQIQDSNGKIFQQWMHGFDIRNHNRSMQHHVENLGVQSRFESLISNQKNIEYELQFCSSYYLFHMRRWAEAITIASGVVDSLVQEVVFSGLDNGIAELLWSKYRNQFRDIFNKILPALGYEKLDKIDKDLWNSFVEAKNYRGAAAHGSINRPFDKDQEIKIQEHLKALYGVSRWLSLQIKRPWALDITADGEILPFV